MILHFDSDKLVYLICSKNILHKRRRRSERGGSKNLRVSKLGLFDL